MGSWLRVSLFSADEIICDAVSPIIAGLPAARVEGCVVGLMMVFLLLTSLGSTFFSGTKGKHADG